MEIGLYIGLSLSFIGSIKACIIDAEKPSWGEAIINGLFGIGIVMLFHKK